MSDKKQTSSDEEVELIAKVAKGIHESGMDIAALIMLQTFKPLSYIGGEMSRVFLEPLLPILGDNAVTLGSQIITVFEKKENIDHLIQLIEEMEKKELDKRKINKNL